MSKEKVDFNLDFNKGRFPLRFLLLSIVFFIFAVVLSQGGIILNDFNTDLFINYLLILVAFDLVVLLLIFGLYPFLNGYSYIVGACLCIIIMCVIVISYLVLTLFLSQAIDLYVFGISLQYMTPESGLCLFLAVLICGPVLFWIEKNAFADKQSRIAAESEHFSNLGFRIRPHFLFNSLNSVASLIPIHPDRAEKALHNLADVFRIVMADKRQLVPLKAELDLADKYLYLEKTRLGNRLKISSRIDPAALSIKVPILLIQPLLENAVYHGIETRFKGGTITTNIKITDNYLVIRITNPLPETTIRRTSGNQVAQQNLRLRIEKTFGKNASFDTYEAESSYNAVIRIPL